MLSIYPWNFVNLSLVYIHTALTNFGRLILIYNKMASVFLELLIIFPFQVLSSSKSDCLDFIDTDEWPQFTQPHFH